MYVKAVSCFSCILFHSSFFTAKITELLAISRILYLNRNTTCEIIFSDSHSALFYLTESYARNFLILIAQRFLHNRLISLILCWILSHIEILGNEAADKHEKIYLPRTPSTTRNFSMMPWNNVTLFHPAFVIGSSQSCRSTGSGAWQSRGKTLYQKSPLGSALLQPSSPLKLDFDPTLHRPHNSYTWQSRIYRSFFNVSHL